MTFVSLSFVLQALAYRRKEGQTPTEWKQEVKAPLQNYGGGDLNIIRQMTANLSKENYTCNAMVLAQKDAPLDLLLGTASLGFLLLETGSNGRTLDLLQDKE